MTEPTSEHRNPVRYAARDHLAVLTLDAPPANTCSYEMMRQPYDAREGIASYTGERKPSFGGR